MQYNTNFVVAASSLSDEIHKLNRNGWYVTQGISDQKPGLVTLTAVHVGYRAKVKATDQQKLVEKIKRNVL